MSGFDSMVDAVTKWVIKQVMNHGKAWLIGIIMFVLVLATYIFYMFYLQKKKEDDEEAANKPASA